MLGYVLYILSVLSNIRTIIIFQGIVIGFGIFGVSVAWTAAYNLGSDETIFIIIKRYLKHIIIYIVFMSCVYIFIPTPKQMASIYIIPKLVNNEEICKIPKKILDLFDLKPEDLKEHGR